MEVVEVSHNKGKQLENHWVDKRRTKKGKDRATSAVPAAHSSTSNHSASNLMILQLFYYVTIGIFSSKRTWQSVPQTSPLPLSLCKPPCTAMHPQTSCQHPKSDVLSIVVPTHSYTPPLLQGTPG